MNEFELIDRLTRSLPTGKSVVAGSGDDCAVLDMGVPGRHLLFKTPSWKGSISFPGLRPKQLDTRPSVVA